jgi:TnpA family transposase
LILHRLGSYARQHSVHQALNEIGRVERTLHVLRTIDDEEFRRQQSRELNKGEAAHDLSRFLFFGKEGALRGRSFDDQFRSFSCLGVLHNPVVAWEHHPHWSSSCAPRVTLSTLRCWPRPRH